MKVKQKIKVLEEINLCEKEMRKYCSPDDRLARFFMQDPDDPNIFTMTGNDKKITRKEVDKYAKYSKIFIIVPASLMNKDRI